MSFFEVGQSERIAVITKERIYTYKQLADVSSKEMFKSKQKEIILLLCKNTIEILSVYVAALNHGHTLMLLTNEINRNLLKNIVEQYKPKWIVGETEFVGYKQEGSILTRVEYYDYRVHPNLAVLLSTSGTTGSQKFVRLSYDNIRANAESIIEYLGIDENERAIMNLPMSYSYGMSIVNSHLLAGATVILTEESVMENNFWELVREQKATSLAGVPFTYQMLQRIGFIKMELPNLKTLTQAGGRLNEKLVKLFGEYAKQNDKRFFVMYGQTEASPRISYIPHDHVLEKAGSIGIAIPRGELSIDAETSELIYKGANVMMGYAECLSDLEKGDVMGGVLHTGDTATLDEDGYFTITGRMKRFIKLFGLRINLDEVEKKLEAEIHTPIASTGKDDKLVVALESEANVELVKISIERLYKLHRTAYVVKVLDQIPRFESGKIDYIKLKELCL